MDMAGKQALLTGATNGIGRVAAVELARAGAEVVLVGRDRQRIAETLAEVAQKAPGARVSAIQADLSLVGEVRRVAAEFKAKHPRLDLLINNAGAVFDHRQTTSEGVEQTFALNHLAYFVLTQELLPLLEQSAPARIVNVASAAHRRAKVDLDDLQWTRRSYAAFQVYSDSKMLNILFTRELARRLQGRSVTANCLHPGVVATGFAVQGRGPVAWLFKLMRPALLSPEQGAETLLHLARSPKVEGVSGRYFDKCQEKATVGQSNDPELARRLWEATEKLLQSLPGGS